MSMKKELHKIVGNKSLSMKERVHRTGLSENELNYHDERFGKKTWQDKKPPRSSWYPETSDREIYGVKK